jgi:hypothetical protein
MNKSEKFGDIQITLTSSYQLKYRDAGSGANRDGAFWHPVGEGAFRPLGSVCVAGYGDLNNNRASMLIADGGNGAVASPVDYNWIWDDSGSGAHMDGSIWRPVAPAGYVALGDVAGDAHSKPGLDAIWCVRADLVADAAYAGSAWDDRGSGGDHDLAAWPIVTGTSSADPTKAVIAPDTFRGGSNYNGAPDAGLAKVLLIPITAEVHDQPTRPQLASRNKPDDTTPPVLDRAVLLPFTAMFEPTDRQSLDKIANPFCRVERWVYWSLVLFNDNTTSVEQSSSKETTVGVSEAESKSFEHSAGVKVSKEFGVGTKVAVELNYQFTYTTSSSRESMRSDTVSRSLTTPAGHAAALWAATYSFRSVRADGTAIGRDLAFDSNTFAHDQYPPATSAAAVATAS